MNTYWMVHGPDGPPHVKHANALDARREAHRLANINPGKTFFVLQAMTAARKVEVQEFDLNPYGAVEKDLDDEIPF